MADISAPGRPVDPAVSRALDQPGVLSRLFHPRPEFGSRQGDENREDLMIPVAPGIAVGASCHRAGPTDPLVLFFHGNGEIVSDYDDLGPVFSRLGLHFLVADFRGYGRSGGSPTVQAMMADCHVILDVVLDWKEKNRITGPVFVMGRSLGSASAIELACNRAGDIAGLIVESGFARTGPLLRVLGIDPEDIGFRPVPGSENLDKIRNVSMPLLVIHAQYDHIIPFSDGKDLHDAAGSGDKDLLMIPGADHNDLFFKGMEAYLGAVRKICCR